MRRCSLLTLVSLTTLLSALVFSPATARGQGDDKAAPKDAKAPAGDAKAPAGDAKAPAGDAKAPAGTGDAKTPTGTGDAKTPTGDQQPGAGGDTRVQLKSLENRVNELKERIFRSKARLNLLKETVLHGVIAGSRAVIKHKNDMGSSFRLTKASYGVDGAQIYSSSDEATLNDKREFDVFNGSIVPGNHTISVVMVFRGHGYGIFTYLKGYRFTVRASYTLTATEGRQNVVVVRAFERGNATTELKDRPAIKFQPNIYKVGTQTKSEGDGQ